MHVNEGVSGEVCMYLFNFTCLGTNISFKDLCIFCIPLVLSTFVLCFLKQLYFLYVNCNICIL